MSFILNMRLGGGGSLNVYHPTSVSTSNAGATAILSGIESMPTGILYFGQAGNNYNRIVLYITDGNGTVIDNHYTAHPVDNGITVTYQSATNTLTLEGTGSYYIFSTYTSNYYIF